MPNFNSQSTHRSLPRPLTAVLATACLAGASSLPATAQPYEGYRDADFREDEPLSRVGTMTLIGDLAGRQIEIWIDDRVVYSGYRDLGSSGEAFRVGYYVEMFPALVAVKIRGCSAPAMMEMEGPQPLIVVNDCDIGMYVEQV